MDKLTIWGRPNAFNVQKVLWTLDELGLEYVHRDAGGALGGLDSAEFLALNPHGRIPVLQDGELTVWESNTIVRYLAARYGSGTLWPEAPAARSYADRWIDWSATALQPDFMKLFWGYYRTPESQRDQHAIDAALAACTERFIALDKQLAMQPYLAGHEFTMADIPPGTTLYRYFEMGLKVPRPPHVLAWYERLAARDAFQKNIMSPFKDLYGRLTY